MLKTCKCYLSICTSVEESGRMSVIWFQLQNVFWKYFSQTAQPNALGWRRFLLEALQIGGYLLFRVDCCLGLIQSTGLQFFYSDWGTKKHRKIPAEILTELFPNAIQMCYCLRQFSWCEYLQKIIFQCKIIKKYETVKMQVFWDIILCADKYLPTVRIWQSTGRGCWIQENLSLCSVLLIDDELKVNYTPCPNCWRWRFIFTLIFFFWWEQSISCNGCLVIL
jgi:hypothetical protein